MMYGPWIASGSMPAARRAVARGDAEPQGIEARGEEHQVEHAQRIRRLAEEGECGERAEVADVRKHRAGEEAAGLRPRQAAASRVERGGQERRDRDEQAQERQEPRLRGAQVHLPEREAQHHGGEQLDDALHQPGGSRFRQKAPPAEPRAQRERPEEQPQAEPETNGRGQRRRPPMSTPR